MNPRGLSYTTSAGVRGDIHPRSQFELFCLVHNIYLAVRSMANNSSLINVSGDIAASAEPIIPHNSG